MNTDYLTSNATNKYPFKDNATLKSAQGAYLSNNTFLDIIAVSYQPEVVGAYLSLLVVDHTQEILTLQFQFFNTAGVDYETFTMAIPLVNVLENEFYGVANDEASIKVVFGAQMVAWKEQLDDVVLNFTKDTATLEQSAVITFVPEVTSISFINWDKNTNEASSSAMLVIDRGEDVTIQARANTFVASSSGAAIDIIRGRGTGLYNDCGSSEPVIRTVNGTGPDSYHNLLFATDDCYVITAHPHGMTLDNHCTPKCTTEQIQGYAYYLNRVNDGMTWVQDYATGLASSLSAQIDNFTYNVLPARNIPSYKVKFEKIHSTNNTRFYYSFSVGFFNTTSTAKTLSLAISSSGNILASSIRRTINNVSVLDGLTSFSVSVPCLKTCIVDFVIYALPPKTASITGTFGTLAINSTTNLT